MLKSIGFTLLTLVVMVLGFLAIRRGLASDAAALIRQAERAVADADAALNERRAPAALAAVERLGPLIDQACLAVERAARKTGGDSSAELRVWRGELLYLRARHVRDRAYARALSADSPLDYVMDTSSGGQFRSYLIIPDDGERSAAVQLLRQAADVLTDRAAVLTDALRVELMFHPSNWPQARTLADALVKLQPEDARALYVLARCDFEQPPGAGTAQATPPKLRQAGRVARALAYVAQLKQTKGYPLWRTVHLEAQIVQWQQRDALARRDPAAARDAHDRLIDLLWGRGDALGRARAGDGLNRPSAWDIEGVLGVFKIALDVRLGDAKAPTDAPAAADVVRAVVDFGVQCRRQKRSGLSADLLTAQAMAALLQSQPLLGRDAPAQWGMLLEYTGTLLKPALLDGQVAPRTCAYYADFLLLQAREQTTTARGQDAATFTAQAADWLRDGLRSAAERKLDQAQQAPLHASLAYLKLRTGSADADVAEHLAALGRLGDPSAQAALVLLESLAHLRRGALDKARERLEQSHRLFVRDAIVRPNVLLAQVYLGLGRPDRALPELRALEHDLNDWDRLSVPDRLWLHDFVPTRDRLGLMLAQAHLDIATEKAARLGQKTPGASADALQLHEDEIEKITRRMPQHSPSLAYLRQGLALYYQSTGKQAQADATLAALGRRRAHRLATFSTALALSEMRGGTADLEQQWRAVLANDANDPEARVILALLLARTGRTGEAVARLTLGVPATGLPGDQLLPEQLDALGGLYMAAARTGLWLEMGGLFAGAAKRYPHDPRIRLREGQALAALRDAGADRPLLCAINLANCRLGPLSAAQRHDLAHTARSVLETLR